MTTLAAVRTARAAPFRAAAVVAVALGVDSVLDPTHTHIPLCPLHAVTGLQCPFCGGLRAASELVRLHLAAALRDNVVFVASLPVLVGLWIAWVLRVQAGRDRRPWPGALSIAVVALAVVFFVVRNLPFAAFLRPAG